MAMSDGENRVEVPTRQRQFEGFLRQNPEVYDSFVAFSNWLWSIGVRRFSAQEIVALLRFQKRLGATISVMGEDGGDCLFAPVPTMENVGVSRSHFRKLAQKLVADDPKFRDFFEFAEDGK